MQAERMVGNARVGRVGEEVRGYVEEWSRSGAREG